MLSEMSQRKMNTGRFHLYVESKKVKQTQTKQNKKHTHTYTHKLGDTANSRLVGLEVGVRVQGESGRRGSKGTNFWFESQSVLGLGHAAW